jgi:hypothetical protein
MLMTGIRRVGMMVDSLHTSTYILMYCREIEPSHQYLLLKGATS